MREFKSVRKQTNELLAGESSFVDFKLAPTAVNQSNLVAFANHEGGVLLVGVDEIVDKSGVHRGYIVGCPVDDGTLTAIESKASDCIPPISIDVAIENTSAKPIIVISVPASDQKPHCTGSGEYKIRKGRRNHPLHPTELLQIFLTKQADQFLANFRGAVVETEQKVEQLRTALSSGTRDLVEELRDLKGMLHGTTSEIVFDLEFMKRELASNLDSILSTVEHGAAESEDAGATVDEVYHLLVHVSDDIDQHQETIQLVREINGAVAALARQAGIVDVTEKRRNERILKLAAVHHLEKRRERDFVETFLKAYPFMTKTEITKIYRSAKKFNEELLDRHR